MQVSHRPLALTGTVAIITALLAMSWAAGPIWAAEIGHFAPGLPNTRDFLMPPPGFYYVQYNFHYSSDDYRDDGGHRFGDFSVARSLEKSRTISYRGSHVDVQLSGSAKARARVKGKLDYKVEQAGFVPTFIFVTPWEVLGGRYGMYISIPYIYAHTHVDVTGNARVDARVDLTAKAGSAGSQRLSITRNAGIDLTFPPQSSHTFTYSGLLHVP